MQKNSILPEAIHTHDSKIVDIASIELNLSNDNSFAGEFQAEGVEIVPTHQIFLTEENLLSSIDQDSFDGLAELSEGLEESMNRDGGENYERPSARQGGRRLNAQLINLNNDPLSTIQELSQDSSFSSFQQIGGLWDDDEIYRRHTDTESINNSGYGDLLNRSLNDSSETEKGERPKFSFKNHKPFQKVTSSNKLVNLNGDQGDLPEIDRESLKIHSIRPPHHFGDDNDFDDDFYDEEEYQNIETEVFEDYGPKLNYDYGKKGSTNNSSFSYEEADNHSYEQPTGSFLSNVLGGVSSFVGSFFSSPQRVQLNHAQRLDSSKSNISSECSPIL